MQGVEASWPESVTTGFPSAVPLLALLVQAGRALTQLHFLYLIDYMMLPNRGMEIRCLMPPVSRVAA